VLALILLVQQIEGNVLQPVLQSKAMGLHAAIVLLSVTVGSTLAGIIGAFLAVPVAATIATVLRYHAEMISLRAKEITPEDIDIRTGAVGDDPEDSPRALHDAAQDVASLHRAKGFFNIVDADTLRNELAQREASLQVQIHIGWEVSLWQAVAVPCWAQGAAAAVEINGWDINAGGGVWHALHHHAASVVAGVKRLLPGRHDAHGVNGDVGAETTGELTNLGYNLRVFTLAR